MNRRDQDSDIKLSISAFEFTYYPILEATVFTEINSWCLLKFTSFHNDKKINFIQISENLFSVCCQFCCQNLVNITLPKRE